MHIKDKVLPGTAEDLRNMYNFGILKKEIGKKLWEGASGGSITVRNSTEYTCFLFVNSSTSGIMARNGNRIIGNSVDITASGDTWTVITGSFSTIWGIF